MNIFKNKTIAWAALCLGLSQSSAVGFTLGATDFSGSNDTVEKVFLLDIDVSGSVDKNTEYGLIMESYAKAFENPSIQNGIINLGSGNGIVVGVEFWSTYQKMLTDAGGNKWFLLNNT